MTLAAEGAAAQPRLKSEDLYHTEWGIIAL